MTNNEKDIIIRFILYMFINILCDTNHDNMYHNIH